jgi:hypothetical protein
VAVLVAAPLTADGAEGVFQADLVGLVAMVGCAAFVVRPRRVHGAALLAAALLLALVHVVAGGPLGGAVAQSLLGLAVGVAASGLAVLGRALGTPALTAGAAAGAVLWIGMTGLVWADDLAESLPRERRFAFRQAVVHLDAATACAFDAAHFDRFHDDRIYRRVPLAASLVRAPAATSTALAWMALGVLAWGGAVGLRLRRDARS